MRLDGDEEQMSLVVRKKERVCADFMKRLTRFNDDDNDDDNNDNDDDDNDDNDDDDDDDVDVDDDDDDATVGEPTKRLGAADKWMMVTMFG